jgi:hypothetical protein
LETATIYQRLIERGRAYRGPEPWSRHADGTDLVVLEDPAATLAVLQQEFTPEALRRAGLAFTDSDKTWHWALGPAGEPAILGPLRHRGEERPFDVLTQRGCLSGRLPVSAALEDAITRDAVESHHGMLLAAFSMQDVGALRAVGLPATLATGLEDLRRERLDAFCLAFAISARYLKPRNAPPAPPPEADGDGGRRIDAMESSEPPGGLTPAAYLDLVLVGWSPGRVEATRPAPLDAVHQRLRRLVADFDLRLDRVHRWQPTAARIATLRARLADGNRGDVLRGLEESLQEDSAAPFRPPPRQRDKPANLAEAIEALHRASVNPTSDRFVQIARWQEYQERLLAECERPLLARAEAGETSPEQAGWLGLAGVSRLVHEQATLLSAQLNREVKRDGLGAFARLPDEEIKQMLATTDRLLALLKQLGPVTGKAAQTRRNHREDSINLSET